MECAVITILNMLLSAILFLMILLEFFSFFYHLYQWYLKI